MTDKLRTIRLYGKLGTKFGREFQLVVSNAAEAVNALCQMIPGFQKHLMESQDNGVGYAVFLGKRNIGEEELMIPPGDEDIRIAPILLGAKSKVIGSVLQVIGGIVLIWAGIAVTAMSFGGASYLGGAMISYGAGMIIGGVVQLLTPIPKGISAQDDPDERSSYSFNGSVNTQAQGNPVPLLYGRMRVGSAVISAGISTEESGGAGYGRDSDDVVGGGYYKGGELPDGA